MASVQQEKPKVKSAIIALFLFVFLMATIPVFIKAARSEEAPVANAFVVICTSVKCGRVLQDPTPRTEGQCLSFLTDTKKALLVTVPQKAPAATYTVVMACMTADMSKEFYSEDFEIVSPAPKL